MVSNPFKKHNITLELSKMEFGLLLSCLRRAIPEGKAEEEIVINLSDQLVQKLKELENAQ